MTFKHQRQKWFTVPHYDYQANTSSRENEQNILTYSQINCASTCAHFVRNLHSITNKTFVHSSLNSCTHVFVRVDRPRRPFENPYKGPFLITKRTSVSIFRIAYEGREKPESGHGRCFGTIAKRYATCPRNVDIELRSHVHESLDR